MGDPQEDWKTYGFECVQFGDHPAAAIMTIAVERAAETYQEVAHDLNIDVEEVKEDSIKLLKDTYVDNGMTGGTKKQVDRMLGSKMEDGSHSGTIPRMMKKVGLRLKTIVTSKSSDQESISKLSDKVLGYLYNPVDDRLGIKFVFNPAKKREGAKVRPDLTINDVDSFIKTPQSRRSLLTICNTVYDPLGLATPFTIKLKILIKETLSLDNPGDWNSPVSTSLVKDWASALKEAITQDNLYFPRSTSSSRAVKKPKLVGFWDGSSQAFSAAVYSVSMVSKYKENNEESLPEGDLEDEDYNPEEHVFISQLVAAKAWVTPLKTGLTIPRSELSGLLLCARILSRTESL